MCTLLQRSQQCTTNIYVREYKHKCKVTDIASYVAAYLVYATIISDIFLKE